MKIVYLSIASNDPIHERDRAAQLNTWVRRVSELDYVYWLRGNSEKILGVQGQDLFVDIAEEYGQILAKTILGLKWLVENLDFDFLIRTNVSTYFQPQLVRAKLQKLPQVSGFAGGYFEYSKENYNHSMKGNQFISGASLILDRSACFKLLEMDPKEFLGVPDDVAISNFLNLKGLQFSYMGRCNLGYSHVFFKHFATRVKSSKNSELAHKRMFLIDSYFSQRGFASRLRSVIRIYYFEIQASKISITGLLDYTLRLFGLSKNFLKARRVIRNG